MQNSKQIFLTWQIILNFCKAEMGQKKKKMTFCKEQNSNMRNLSQQVLKFTIKLYNQNCEKKKKNCGARTRMDRSVKYKRAQEYTQLYKKLMYDIRVMSKKICDQ